MIIGPNLKKFIINHFSDREVKGYVSSRVPVSEHYIQIATALKDMDIHYEIYQDHVELHIEGKYQGPDKQDFVNQLRQHSYKNPSLSWLSWQGKEQFRCRINKTLNNPDEIVDAFKAIIEIFDPIIEAVLKQQTMQENNTSPKSNEQNIDAAIVSVGEILNMSNLCIPAYQRPYRWSEKNVRQLLEDILESKNAGKKSYRIGSVILYYNEEKTTLDIVDGQQRLTTLFILAKACGESTTQNSLKYNHFDSVTNIKNNYH